MTRWAVVLLPLAGILAVDPVSVDYHAVKYFALMIGAAICLLAIRRFVWTDLSLALWVFVGVRGLMLLNSPMEGRSVRWWGLLLALTLVHHLAVSRRWLRARAPQVCGLLLGALSLYAAVQYLAGARQAQALFANRNFAGAGLAMLLPFAMTLSPWLLLAAVPGLAATQSRGGVLAAAAALALWFAWSRPRLRLPLLLGAPVLVLAAGLWLGESNTVKARFAWYRAAAKIGLDHPLAGTGAGGFAREYPPRRPVEEYSISGGDRVHSVHDDYLESFAEGGLLGVAAHALLLLFAARAARRHRAAACSLAAFAVASLVDLPLRDPSLLALAFLSLAMVARRRRLPAWGVVPAAVAVVAVVALLPSHLDHWRADHLYGRFCTQKDRALLDEALDREPRHPLALMERGREEDLEKLLEMEPHHAGARYNLTEHLLEQEAIEQLTEILLDHDPHHTLTRVRLAVLTMKRDPVAAASLLNDAIDADPRPYRPYALLAHIHRKARRLEQAERFLKQAEQRSGAVEVRRERLHLEMAKKNGRVEAAARRMPPDELSHMIRKALARAEQTESGHRRPRLQREAGEGAADFAKRVQKAQGAWLARVLPLTRPDYREAATLAGALVAIQPTVAAHFRLLARAQRGLRNRKTAGRAEGLALLIEAQLALDAEDQYRASQKLKRALTVCPELAEDEAVLDLKRKLTGGG